MTIKERLNDEIEQLTAKIERLIDFIESEKFSELDVAHKDLLDEQLSVMLDYKQILTIRAELLA